MAVGNPYTEVVVTGYNPDPPSNDGQITTANTVDWDGIKDDLAEPVKTATESTQSNITTALDKRVMNGSLTKTGAYTIVLADRGKDVRFTGTSAFTFTLPAVVDAKNGFELLITNAGTAVLTLDGSGAELVGGLITQDFYPGQTMWIYCDGTVWNITADSSRSGVLAKTATYTVLVSDKGRTIDCDGSGGAFTITLPTVATAKNGFSVSFKKTDTSANAVMIDGDSAETIDGALTKSLAGQYNTFTLLCDGVTWHVVGGQPSLILETEIATTSGTSHDFTGISDTAKKITVMFDGLSTSGTSIPIIQIGDSGGIEATGYDGSTTDLAGGIVNTLHNTGALLRAAHTASLILHGSVSFTLMDAANTWQYHGNLGRSDTAGTSIIGGGKTLTATLDRVRLTTVGGSDTFDAGFVNILIEG